MANLGRMRVLVAVAAVASLAAILLHGCSEQPTEPVSQSRVAKYALTIGAGSSAGSGTVVSNRGGISCTITGNTSAATTSGSCSQSYKVGTIVTVTATAATGSALRLDAEWQGCTPNVEDHRVCQVTMNGPRSVAPTFVPTSTAFTVTVSGGAGGSGTVISTPTGINCTITNGQANSGNCSAGFTSGSSVKLSASASTGSYLKAWAGGSCETAGNGVGTASGSCTTSVSSNVNAWSVSIPSRWSAKANGMRRSPGLR